MKTAREPFFSVVIPTHNRANMVLEAIHSVLEQKENSFEILVIDNGSSDDTALKVKSIQDDRVHYHYRKPSDGPAWPRNLGLDKAIGGWVCFLDSDDVWHPEKLSTVRAYINEFPDREVFVHWQNETDKNGVYLKTLRPDPVTFVDYRSMLTTENTIVTSTVCSKRSFLNKYSIRFKEDVEYIAIEDYDFWLQILFHGGNFYCIQKILGEMRTPQNRIGISQVFWRNMPVLFRYHSLQVQNFTQRRKLLLRRLLASLSLRKAFSSLREGEIYSVAKLFVQAFTTDPFEIFRYVYFRLKQRFRRYS